MEGETIDREPQTKREWRVAWRYARDERNIARAEAERLREAIDRHRQAITSYVGADEHDERLWAVLEPRQ